MDCYSYIKMVNYIRLQKPDPRMLMDTSMALWEDECYLKPGEMEPWLMYGMLCCLHSLAEVLL